MNEKHFDSPIIPSWFPIVGALAGFLTLIFFMWLVASGKAIDCHQRFPIVVIISLGASLAGSFLGGWATAQGHLPIPVTRKNTIRVSVGGGIGILFIILLLGHHLYRCDDSTTPPVQTQTTEHVMTSATEENLSPSIIGEFAENTVEQMREKLRGRDSLRLNGTFEISNRPTKIAVNTLTLKQGSQIITNGNDLHIQALKLNSENGAISSFSQDHMNPPQTSGDHEGVKGLDAGSVNIEVYDSISGSVQIQLNGQNGGRGGKGKDGANGSGGSRGEDAQPGIIDCKKGGGDGGTGGIGAAGERGFPGGNGGSGGSIIIRVASHHLKKDAEAAFSLHNKGGIGGAGGEGGTGGKGGPGGPGGGGKGLCSGGNPGPPGQDGPHGDKGPDGQTGNDGTKQVEVM